jgi:CRP-like cAMP-binding protein
MDTLAMHQTLTRLYIFSALAASQLDAIASQSQIIDIPRNSYVFNRGDRALGLYVLLSGQIKLGMTSPQGGEKVISLVSPGESFGEAVMFLERDFPVFAQAMLDSKVLIVNKSIIFSLLDTDATVARKMLAGLSIRMHQLVQDIEMLSLQSSMQRFIGYLLQISADAPASTKVTLPSNKATIASLLNLTPETLSRTLTRLQQVGLIDVQGKEISIQNVAKLRSFDLKG